MTGRSRIAMSHPTSHTAPPAPAVDPNDLRVTRLRALRGANHWRLAPVIACDVRLGALEGLKSSELPGFTERLLAALPTLEEHPCTRDVRGGFVERLREGTEIPHILEHVALELQTLSGAGDVGFGRVVPSGDADVWWVIVSYEEEEVGLQSMRDGVRLIRACLVGEAFDADGCISALQELYEGVRLGPSTAAIVEEARRRGIPVRRLNNHTLVQLGLGRNRRRIQATLSDYTSGIAVEIAQDKADTKRVLESIGLPVPKGDVVRTIEGAVEAAEEIGFPVILKPLDASHGRGISGTLTDPNAVRAAWADASAYSRSVIVETFARGRDHRVLVVNGRVVAAAERVPARVVGDGRSTVRALIDEGNRDPRRGVGHTKILTRLPADRRTEQFLARSRRTLDTVPAAGEVVELRGTANLSTGGTSIDRTDEIHPDNVTACEMAAGAVGLDIAGIDVVTEDISIPFRDNGAVIIEVNAAPGIRMHTHPTEGKARNVGAAVIDMLYPPGSDFTIPVIAVTGTNGKTTTVRLVAHLFRHTGKTVGFTTTDGVYLQNRLVMEGDMTGPFSANIILSNPTVDVAVLETARGGILRAGLGFDECDVGVITNVSADHLGLGGIHTVEQLAALKGVVAAVVKRDGHAVLNADDPLVLPMRERTGADVVLFSTQPEGANEAFEEHLARGGIGVRIEGGTFVIRRGRLRIPVAPVTEVPLMLNGAAAFQRGNILAAIATAYVQGIRYDDIRAGLLTFFPSNSLTPGRLNLMRVGPGRVLLDYAHNAAAVAGLMELVRNLEARRRIGVITSPGDRRDDDIRTLGRLCAGLDHVIVKEDQHRRGRGPGEIADLVVDGLREGGMPEDCIERVFEEPKAMARALEMLGPDDLVVSLVDDVPSVLAQMRSYVSRAD
ncbi:MAG TPA: cyanophycin synthetase [Gemmatimonadaceae bacterium]|nr:cyanophycin synthetase [Gemmatimonadaceae bacterium]